MNNTTQVVNDKKVAAEIVSWLFGMVAAIIGIINIFWGNDPGYGIFIFLLSFVFVPPATKFLKTISGISISWIIKVLLALFIIWTAMGVAELPDKIELMIKSFQQ